MNEMVVGVRRPEYAVHLEGQVGAAPSSGKSRLAPWLVAIYFVVAAVVQLAAGSYSSEVSHYADEASHVVTSLLIRDYLVDGIGENPVKFAENYYVHYPKVGFGMWPPVFHTTAAVWTLAFGTSRASFLALVALEAAILAWLVFLVARRWMPFGMAAFAGGLSLLPRMMTELYTSVMVDVLVAVLSLAAVLLLIRYLECGETRWAAAYGAMAAAAMLTKGNAIALVLVPILMVAMGRRWDLLKRPGLYVAALIVAVFGLPWQVVSARYLATSVPFRSIGWEWFANLAAYYWVGLWRGTGALMLIAGAGGLLWVLWNYARAPRVPAAQAPAALACMVLSVYLFHLVVPTPPDGRYLAAAIAPLVCLAVTGAAGLARWIREAQPIPAWFRPNTAAAALLLLGAGYGFAGNGSLPRRNELGFQKALALADAHRDQGAKDEVLLVASEVLGEGALITEVALGESRPGRYVLRATKVISQSNWFREKMQLLHESPEALLQYLDSVPVDVVFLDRTKEAYPEERDLLSAAIVSAPERWVHLEEAGGASDGRVIDVYRRSWRKDEPRPVKRTFRVAMPHTLGRELAPR